MLGLSITIEDRIALFKQRAGRKQIPTAFVALLEGKITGFACLVAHDMETRKDLSPWLASVLVAPEYRSRGVGTSLSLRVVQEARSLEIETLYLLTFDKEKFYERLG